MKVEVTQDSPVRRTLEIEADADLVERETRQVLRRYARETRIPGFRPGKAPEAVIRRRFDRQIREDVRDRLISRLYAEATREKGLHPLGEPMLRDVEFEPGHPFRFTTTFEVLPQITLGEYRGVEVREPKAEVTDADVEKMLQELRESQARLVSAPDREAGVGDVVVADLEGRGKGVEPFRRENVMLEVGASRNLPEFNEGVAGVRVGEHREFSVRYPAEYENHDLAGREVAYAVDVHEVKRREMPELDDEFAKDLGEFSTLAELRDRIRNDLLERRKAEARETVRQRVLDKVLLGNPLPLPDVLVEEEIRARLEDVARSMILQGVDPREAKVDWKQVREAQEEPARKTVHARLVLDAVARAESVAVTPEEVNARVTEEAARIGEKPDVLRAKLSKGGGLKALKNQMVREKSLDLLTSIANILSEE